MKTVKNQRNIKNQFGTFKINSDEEINFENGMIGISYATKFALIKCPLAKFNNFMVLQSTEYDDLSFMLLKVDALNDNYYDIEELKQVCQDMEMDWNQILIHLIVSIKKNDNGKQLIANMKAPVFIDSLRKIGKQYVLHNQKYELQKEI